MVQARIKNIFSRVRDRMLTKENKILMAGRLYVAFVFSNNIYTSKSGKSTILHLLIFNVRR